MISYLTAFIFYTLAMVGILLLGFVVYKKFNFPSKQDSRGIIKIIDSCPIGAKKNLLVVKIGNEKFLIASGLEHTTFLSKLDNNSAIKEEEIKQPTKTIELKQASSIPLPPKEPQQNFVQKQQEEKDIYDFLYSQSKKLEEQKLAFENENIPTKNPINDSNRVLKELYMQKAQQTQTQAQSAINSRKQLMQELLNEIHQTKLKTGSRR